MFNRRPRMTPAEKVVLSVGGPVTVAMLIGYLLEHGHL